MQRLTLYITVLLLLGGASLSSQQLENFYLENQDKEEVSLEEVAGDKITIIDFWATWCKPCTKAMPKLNDIYNTYKDQGVNMVGISCDGPRSIGKVDMLANSMDIDYTILKDINCEVMKSMDYQAFPTLIIIDENQEVVWLHEGFVSGDEIKIEEAIQQFLK